MENEEKYLRRTLKDYTLSFKLSVVNEVKSEALTLTQASLKYLHLPPLQHKIALHPMNSLL